MSQPPAKRRKLSITDQSSTAKVMTENFEAITTSLQELRSHIKRGQSQMKDLRDCLNVLEIQLERFVVLERGERERMESGRTAEESGFEADTEWSSSFRTTRTTGESVESAVDEDSHDHERTISDSGSICCSESHTAKYADNASDAVSESCLDSCSGCSVRGGCSSTSLAGNLQSDSDSD